MFLQAKLSRERERLHGAGMTAEERAWRAQWIKDQHLSPNEPRYVPELERELKNPIRRFYRAPMDKLQNALVPKVVSALRAYVEFKFIFVCKTRLLQPGYRGINVYQFWKIWKIILKFGTKSFPIM